MNCVNTRQRFIRITGLGLMMLGLSGCDWVGFAIKEGALSFTGRSGGESFTIEGKLPANFAIEVQANYGPVESKNCQTYSIGLGQEITRDHMESFKARYPGLPELISAWRDLDDIQRAEQLAQRSADAQSRYA
jgi:hypothetical protein